jgi:hypothetical protein
MMTTNPTTADFDELLAYLPLFSDEEFQPVRNSRSSHNTGTASVYNPWPEYTQAVLDFVSAAEKDCWCDPEYPRKEIARAGSDRHAVACATLEDIQSMLTWCVRGERFCDGHWRAVIEDKTIHNILVRLRELSPQ